MDQTCKGFFNRFPTQNDSPKMCDYTVVVTRVVNFQHKHFCSPLMRKTKTILYFSSFYIPCVCRCFRHDFPLDFTFQPFVTRRKSLKFGKRQRTQTKHNTFPIINDILHVYSGSTKVHSTWEGTWV